MTCTRRLATVALVSGLFSLLVGCSGPNSRLVTVRSGGGEGAVDFALKNLSDAPVNAFYLAKTERVNAAGPEVDFDSPQGQELWGPDLMAHAALGIGDRMPLPVPEPGLWDARALDRDGRYQHITSLHLAAGGRYILELNSGGWRAKR